MIDREETCTFERKNTEMDFVWSMTFVWIINSLIPIWDWEQHFTLAKLFSQAKSVEASICFFPVSFCFAHICCLSPGESDSYVTGDRQLGCWLDKWCLPRELVRFSEINRGPGGMSCAMPCCYWSNLSSENKGQNIKVNIRCTAFAVW